MTQLLKGAQVVESMTARLTREVEELKARGVEPCLAILRVGEKPDQLSYERGATKRCAGLGIAVKSVALPEDAAQGQVLDAVKELNANGAVHGILLLQPLPKGLDGDAIRNAIDPRKDVDCIGDAALGAVFVGASGAFAPCTAQACIEICDHYGIELQGKRVVIVGRSLVVGKPAAMLFMARNATVTVCHSRTLDLPSVTREADILVVAMGRAKFIGASCAASGQTVIDVGINWDQEAGRLVGDVDFDAVEPLVDAITPVPGGTGAVTNCVLADHAVQAARRQQS